MYAFSLMHHPLTVSHNASGAKKKTRDTVTILSGRNKIDDDIWDEIKKAPQVQKRIEDGYLRASTDTSKDLNKRDKANLLSRPSTAYIGDLCAKAEPIATGESGRGERDFLTYDEQKQRGLL